MNSQLVASYIQQSQVSLAVVGLGFLVSPGFAEATYHSTQFAIEAELMRNMGRSTEQRLRAAAEYRIAAIRVALADDGDDSVDQMVSTVEKALHAYITGDDSALREETDSLRRKRESRPDFGSFPRRTEREEPIEDEDAPEGDNDFWSGLLGR